MGLASAGLDQYAVAIFEAHDFTEPEGDLKEKMDNRVLDAEEFSLSVYVSASLCVDDLDVSLFGST